jgi:hypothetical protein
MLFGSSYCIAGHKIYNAPSSVQAKYEKLIAQSDTFIMYNRSCGTCYTGTPYLIYFVYKKKSRIMMEVYSWESPAVKLKGKRILKRRLKWNKGRQFIDYAIENYDSLEIESGNNMPFRKNEKHVGNNGEEFIMFEDGNRHLQGPSIKYEIIFREKDLYGRVFGVENIKQVSSVLPTTGNMMRLFHDFYSKYSKEKIVDQLIW